MIQGDGGYPEKSKTAIIEFYESDDVITYQFICATSYYQMEFTLDEMGRYYEDNRITASSFDKTIEKLAIWDELKTLKGFKIISSDKKFKTPDLDKELGLTVISEASDQYTLWFKNDDVYMRQRKELTTLVVSESSNLKTSIELL